ncbi:MAG: class I SAM-dependent methyltransferase [Polyangiaceae bacterium]|nr:class I SAM-dependent methyltransferase [Polyangiaceae bacterium]
MENAARHFYAMESRLTAAVSERMLDLADLRAGMRVLDLASGRGEPLLRAAKRVGPDGHVLGVDVDEQALADARATAASRGLSNVELRVGSAEDVDVTGRDAVTARWAFMASPERVLAAVRRALRPEATFVAAYWAEPERAPWATLPRRVIARYAPLPPVDPARPGAFYYASVARIEADYAAANLAVTHVEETRVAVVEGARGEDIVDWVRGVLGRLLDGVAPADRAACEAELAREAEAHRDGERIRLGGVTRIIVAKPSVAGAGAAPRG